MAEAMIKHPERAREYLEFYRHVRSHFRDSVADGGEEMLCALLNRDALEDMPTLHGELLEQDEAFAEAFAAASDEWREQIEEWAYGDGFGKARWWRAIEARSQELRSARAV